MTLHHADLAIQREEDVWMQNVGRGTHTHASCSEKLKVQISCQACSEVASKDDPQSFFLLNQLAWYQISLDIGEAHC